MGVVGDAFAKRVMATEPHGVGAARCSAAVGPVGRQLVDLGSRHRARRPSLGCVGVADLFRRPAPSIPRFPLAAGLRPWRSTSRRPAAPAAGSELGRLARQPDAPARYWPCSLDADRFLDRDRPSFAGEGADRPNAWPAWIRAVSIFDDERSERELRGGGPSRTGSLPLTLPRPGPVRPTKEPSIGAEVRAAGPASASHCGGHPPRAAGSYFRSRPCQWRPDGRPFGQTIDRATRLRIIGGDQGWP